MEKVRTNKLFALYDSKPVEKIDDMIWKLVEPKWARPFREEQAV